MWSDTSYAKIRRNFAEFCWMDGTGRNWHLLTFYLYQCVYVSKRLMQLCKSLNVFLSVLRLDFAAHRIFLLVFPISFHLSLRQRKIQSLRKDLSEKTSLNSTSGLQFRLPISSFRVKQLFTCLNHVTFRYIFTFHLATHFNVWKEVCEIENLFHDITILRLQYISFYAVSKQ